VWYIDHSTTSIRVFLRHGRLTGFNTLTAAVEKSMTEESSDR